MILAGVEVWFLCIGCGAEYRATFPNRGTLRARCWVCGDVLTAAGTGVIPGAPKS